MNSYELFHKLRPYEQKKYSAQLNADGLNFNTSEMFSTLIKDAARCNNYNSDIVYDIDILRDAFRHFDFLQVPIWIGFRKLGVDNTDYVLLRCCDDKENFRTKLSAEYFALYSISFEVEAKDWIEVTFSKYSV